MDKSINDINFIFYISGSMGSLLSVLIKSQTQESFIFDKFNDNTAHAYRTDAFYYTHDWEEYKIFKKSSLSLTEHLQKNYKENNSFIQRSHICWLDEFAKEKKLKKILCYIDDYYLKLYYFYSKLGKQTLERYQDIDLNFNFNIKKDHKNYETIFLIKTFNWCIEFEKKYMNVIPSINMLPILKKDYEQLSKICTIKNTEILDKIINDYNKNDTHDSNLLPKEMKDYCKKYHNII